MNYKYSKLFLIKNFTKSQIYAHDFEKKKLTGP